MPQLCLLYGVGLISPCAPWNNSHCALPWVYELQADQGLITFQIHQPYHLLSLPDTGTTGLAGLFLWTLDFVVHTCPKSHSIYRKSLQKWPACLQEKHFPLDGADIGDVTESHCPVGLTSLGLYCGFYYVGAGPLWVTLLSCYPSSLPQLGGLASSLL